MNAPAGRIHTYPVLTISPTSAIRASQSNAVFVVQAGEVWLLPSARVS